ncbi:MAG: diadenylate cyclase CdaA [Spirochaetia bacterium]|nr:diadenylate cyclase CdaA [Spirochaetia bacterium]
MNSLLEIPASLIRNIIDIFLVFLFIYNIYKLIRHTRATPVIMGMTILFVVSIVSKLLKLETVTWIFEGFSAYVLIAIIVILQPELRRLFYRLGETRLYRLLFQTRNVPIEEILQACQQMMDEKTGALMVIVNHIGLRHLAEGGIPLQANLTKELLISIFYGENPLHDGAVIIEGSQIISAATYLPLSSSSRLKKTHGSRHRAGLGISEESDAISIVVSEQKRKISVCYMGEILESVDPIKLKSLLTAFNNDRLNNEWQNQYGGQT